VSRPFEGMSKEAAYFYARVFGEVMLNMHAVRMGFFDTYLCETEDPNVALRFRSSVPELLTAVRLRNQRNLEDDDGR